MKLAVHYYTADGRFEKRLIDADSILDAESTLKASGHSPVKIEHHRSAGKVIFNYKLPDEDLIDLLMNLRLQALGGINPSSAIESILEFTTNRRLKAMLHYVHESITTGKAPLHVALAKFPRTFTPAYCAVLKAGEGSGLPGLAENLSRLRERIQFNLKIRRQIGRGIAYPAFLLFLAINFIVGMMIFGVPTIKKMLKEMNADLPAVTQLLIDASDAFVAAKYFIGASVLAIPIAYFFARKTKGLNLYFDSLLVRLPVLGPIYCSLVTATFASYYRTMYMASGNIADSLAICAGLFKNAFVHEDFMRIRRGVLEEDINLPTALARSRVINPVIVPLVKAGEASKSLPEMLAEISVSQMDFTERRINSLLSVLPLVIMVFMAVFIGFLAAAVILPTLNIYAKI